MNVYDSPIPDLQQQALISNPPPGTSLLPENISPWLLLGGTVAALCLISTPDRAKVGQADYSKYILPAGLLIGGYLLIKNLLGSSDTSAQNAKTTAQVQATTAAAIQQAAAAGDVQRVPDAQLQAFADDIYTKALQGTNADQVGIENDMLQLLTLTDLLKLKQFYGTRPFNTGGAVNLCALFSVNCTAVDLDSTLKGVLSADTLGSINTYLSAQNINYQF